MPTVIRHFFPHFLMDVGIAAAQLLTHPSLVAVEVV